MHSVEDSSNVDRSTRTQRTRCALAVIGVLLMLSACGGGESVSADIPHSAPVPEQSAQPPAPTSSVITTTELSGKATYQRVPHNPETNGLMYALSYSEPIRGAVVDLVDKDGVTLDTTATDEQGRYAFTTDAGRAVSVRVKAMLLSEGVESWDIRVVDNVSEGALYTLASSLFTTNGERMTRDLEAASGWGRSEYTGMRAAAPFAILDTLYASVEQVKLARPGIQLPPLEVNWSVHNRPTSGDFENGEIGSSLFRPAGGGREIYILGAEDADTDEYDAHVIAHEFVHYLHYHLSRSDSIGGGHSIGDRLDPRVAFGEGLASALAAIVLDDPVYVDTLGFDQAAGASFNIENGRHGNKGWYNEGSVQSLVYDLYDDQADGSDNLALGFAPVLEALTGSLREDAALVTIHAYLKAIKDQHPAIAGMVDNLASMENIRSAGSDAYGHGEVNSAFRADKVLPIYTELPLNGRPVKVCTMGGSSGFGTNNKLGNRRFLRFTIDAFNPAVATLITATGPEGSDPDLVLHQAGRVQSSLNATNGVERLRRIYTPGDYVLEVYEYTNLTSTPMGNVCFDLSVSTE